MLDTRLEVAMSPNFSEEEVTCGTAEEMAHAEFHDLTCFNPPSAPKQNPTEECPLSVPLKVQMEQRMLLMPYRKV